MTEPLERLRRDIGARLPDWISQALAVYRGFAGEPPATEPKVFAAQQAACRAALGHVDALLRLARWAAEDEAAAAEAENLAEMAAEARAALARRGGE